MGQAVRSLAASIVAIFVLTALVPLASARAASPWVMGYYPVYERDQMPGGEIEWGNMTHLAVGAALPGRTGSLNLSFYLGSRREGTTFVRTLTQAAHDNDVKTVLMVGGAGAQRGFIGAASRANRARFVRNLVHARKNLGMDGLDIDWEPLRNKDLRPLNALLAALRRADPSALLTLPLTPYGLGATVPPAFSRIATRLDQLNLMTYGMDGPWSGWKSWHSSALHGATAETPLDVEHAVADVENAGVPADKIGLGVGFYGQCWTGVTAPNQAVDGASVVDGELGYRDIVTSYYQPGIYTYDTTAQAPYLGSTTAFGPKDCTYLTYEDTASIQAKGAWAQSQGLGGVIVWSIPKAHFSGATHPDALLGVVKTAFGA